MFFVSDLDGGVVLLDPSRPPALDAAALEALNAYFDIEGQTCAVSDHPGRNWGEVWERSREALQRVGLGRSWHVIFASDGVYGTTILDTVDVSPPSDARLAGAVDVTHMQRAGMGSGVGVFDMYGTHPLTSEALAPPPADANAGWPVPMMARSLEFWVRQARERVIGVQGSPSDEALVLRWTTTPANGDPPRLSERITIGTPMGLAMERKRAVRPGAFLLVWVNRHPRQPGRLRVGSRVTRDLRFDEGSPPSEGRILARVVRMEGRTAVLRPATWTEVGS